MTSERVVVLAVTKMLSGMCTGGISLATKKWVRPVKEHSTLLLGDLTYRDRTVIRPFDVVDFSLIKPRRQPPHTEDWVCDFVRSRPVRVDHMTDRLEFMQTHSEPDSPGEILQAERSLALYEPADVEAHFHQDNYSGKYAARLKLPEMKTRPLPVTDIKWRALGRKLLGTDEFLVLTVDDIRKLLGVERVFVALGLGRRFEGNYWPLIVGVHTWPDYEAEVNYRDL